MLDVTTVFLDHGHASTAIGPLEVFRDAGVLTCAKHFPGHGSTGEDSHETLPEVRKSLDELRDSDLAPFKRAVEAGADMMMMSHIIFSFGDSTDRNEPAMFYRKRFGSR